MLEGVIGAIAGDIIGSIYEHNPVKQRPLCLFSVGSHFTDDTILTLAIAENLMDGGDLHKTLQKYYRKYPHAGYGAMFSQWAKDQSSEPYGSWGNGAAMRVSAIPYWYESMSEVLDAAEKSAIVTHNHEESVAAARAVAGSIWLADVGATKEEIQYFAERTGGYNLSVPLDSIRDEYSFDVSCQGSVPQSIRCFLESDDFEDAVRIAISLGGDADTMASIAGSIAGAFHGIPEHVSEEVGRRLDGDLCDLLWRFFNSQVTHVR
jgi:ADP-ribosylglycohydrolase